METVIAVVASDMHWMMRGIEWYMLLMWESDGNPRGLFRQQQTGWWEWWCKWHFLTETKKKLKTRDSLNMDKCRGPARWRERREQRKKDREEKTSWLKMQRFFKWILGEMMTDGIRDIINDRKCTTHNLFGLVQQRLTDRLRVTRMLWRYFWFTHAYTNSHIHMQESLYKLEVVPYQQTVSYEDQMVPSSLDVYLIFTDVACFIGDRGRPIVDAWVTQQGKHKIEIEPFRKKFNCTCWAFLIIILKSDVGHIYADENVWTSAQNLQEDAESLLAIWRVDRNIEWKSQSATISIGSDTNDKSFFICIYFAFSHTCSTQVYPFLSLVWGYRAREGEKSFFSWLPK